jgi:uncharacterized membrane protein YphA (DoxX/SURF4 family)
MASRARTASRLLGKLPTAAWRWPSSTSTWLRWRTSSATRANRSCAAPPEAHTDTREEISIVTYVLWIVQALLALIFLSAGTMKLVLPLDTLSAQVPLPGLFVRFVGVAEVLGGLGLILPGLLRIRPNLTPLAAAELVHVMLGATLVTIAIGGDAVLALMPLAVGLLAAFVAYGRWRLAPHRGRRASRPVLQPAG